MAKYKLKTTKVEEKVVETYQKIENGVLNTYQKVEDSVVDAYKKVENAFVDTFLEKTEEDENAGEQKQPH